jgi:hypothetical protein
MGLARRRDRIPLTSLQDRNRVIFAFFAVKRDRKGAWLKP